MVPGQMKQCALDFRETFSLRTRPCDHNNVKAANESVFIQTIAFADESGNVVSHNAVSDFFTDRYPDAVFLRAVPYDDHYQISVSE